MKSIEIKTQAFFELLKHRGMSMWCIFSELLGEEEQLIIFKDEEGKELTRYLLPTSQERLEEDRKLFSEQFKKKLSHESGA